MSLLSCVSNFNCMSRSRLRSSCTACGPIWRRFAESGLAHRNPKKRSRRGFDGHGRLQLLPTGRCDVISFLFWEGAETPFHIHRCSSSVDLPQYVAKSLKNWVSVGVCSNNAQYHGIFWKYSKFPNPVLRSICQGLGAEAVFWGSTGLVEWKLHFCVPQASKSRASSEGSCREWDHVRNVQILRCPTTFVASTSWIFCSLGQLFFHAVVWNISSSFLYHGLN